MRDCQPGSPPRRQTWQLHMALPHTHSLSNLSGAPKPLLPIVWAPHNAMNSRTLKPWSAKFDLRSAALSVSVSACVGERSVESCARNTRLTFVLAAQ
eukprot:361292-Chlamydomonas_euryale.AAC.4